jgi:hypothetical protein
VITVPQEVDNLLVAGRCVAGDQISHAVTRQMICCTVTVQGAGVTDAVSIKQVQKALQRFRLDNVVSFR